MHKRGRLPVIAAALLSVALLLVAAQTHGALSDGLMWAWLLDCVFLAIVLVWAVLRRLVGHRQVRPVVAAKAQAPEDAPVVTCLVELPASSPSREDAERELPEYCARLIDRSPG